MRSFILLLLCLPLHALAHSDGHERMKQLDAQIRNEPDNAELHLRRGRLYIEENHFEEARADLEKTLALAPTQHGARYFLAEALLYGGKAELAEQQAQRFIDAHGAQELGALSRGYWLLGQARLAQQHPEAAIAAYRMALKAHCRADARPLSTLRQCLPCSPGEISGRSFAGAGSGADIRRQH